jgi:hypothetical protein
MVRKSLVISAADPELVILRSLKALSRRRFDVNALQVPQFAFCGLAGWTGGFPWGRSKSAYEDTTVSIR